MTDAAATEYETDQRILEFVQLREVPRYNSARILVPGENDNRKSVSDDKQTFSCSEQRADSDSPSLVVDKPLVVNKPFDKPSNTSRTRTRTRIDRLSTSRPRWLPTRTTKTWGITGSELNRLSAAVRFMKLDCHSSRTRLWLLTTDSDTPRFLIAAIWKRITRLQTVFRLPPYSVITFEGRNGLHAHIVFIGTTEIARRLKASRQFGGVIDVRRVTDPHGLFKYLAKERTPQAGYRREHVLGGRLNGSHRLEGGGDRVRLSRQLERDAIDFGYVKPWRHTYAKRRPPDGSPGCGEECERYSPSGGCQ